MAAFQETLKILFTNSNAAMFVKNLNIWYFRLMLVCVQEKNSDVKDSDCSGERRFIWKFLLLKYIVSVLILFTE